jgi:hypothetical protein
MITPRRTLTDAAVAEKQIRMRIQVAPVLAFPSHYEWNYFTFNKCIFENWSVVVLCIGGGKWEDGGLEGEDGRMRCIRG